SSTLLKHCERNRGEVDFFKHKWYNANYRPVKTKNIYSNSPLRVARKKKLMNREQAQTIEPVDALLMAIPIEDERARLKAREDVLIRQFRNDEIRCHEYHKGMEGTSYNLTDVNRVHVKVIEGVDTGEIRVRTDTPSRLGSLAAKLGLGKK